MWSLAPPGLTLVLIVAQVLGSTSDVHYVKSNGPSPENCLNLPCLTLDQYIQHTNRYFTTGSTFVFLAGNHTLQDSMSVRSISNLTLRGKENSSEVNIICTPKFTILCNNVTNLSIEWLKFVLTTNQQEDAAALKAIESRKVSISNSIFLGSGDTSQTTAYAVFSMHSNITFLNCHFEGNTGNKAGAVFASKKTNLVLCGNVFMRNYRGSVIYLTSESSMMLRGTPKNEFLHNSVDYFGGAIYCDHCMIDITGSNSFKYNHLLWKKSKGGAICMVNGNLTISGTVQFSRNKASEGGAINLEGSTALLSGKAIVFRDNSAEYGGGMSSRTSVVKMSAKILHFINNTAQIVGGGLCVGTTDEIYGGSVEVSATFINNRAKCGGAAFFEMIEVVHFKNTRFVENLGSALCTYNSNLTFTGNTVMVSNDGNLGGGISSKNSVMTFTDDTWFEANHAFVGGAINSLQGNISFHGVVTFVENTAQTDGGALYALGTIIALEGTAEFTSNSAQNGGAMYFRSEATLILTHYATLNTFNNRASLYGGAIYHQDSTTSAQCNFTASILGTSNKFLPLPYCFFQPGLQPGVYRYGRISSYNDSAGKDGNFLYGGLLDKCRPRPKSNYLRITLYRELSEKILMIATPQNSSAKGLSSKAYELYFCDCNSTDHNCTRTRRIEVFRGQKFTLPLLAIAQGDIIISTLVTAITHNSRLDILQNSQTLPQSCSNLTYNLYSAQDYIEMILYPDGPCRDSGLARLVINVTFLHCPAGFTQFSERCICEERLRAYDVNCTIDDESQITRNAGSKFWMDVLYYPNGSYQGLILYKTCPAEYCKVDTIAITLDDLDIQCDLNRSGVLCGACVTNYSLLLGSSKCAHCSNVYLALMFPFACAGIALVAFLTFLKLTVATGPINSLILYANIVQVNKMSFFPVNAVNPLTVFIAWLNLDLGIETCFYDGMNAYVQTCLQFAFPVYVWLLISLIIVTSRYSVNMSRLIGSNPIAVLATLLLMSYTKILRIIIEVYSSIKLDYPNNSQVLVWLKDGNEPYLRSRHLLLTVITSLMLVFLFLPYTILLLLGHKLYRFTDRKCLFWLNRMKPLLDSYYAPYKTHTRYWTGFLLLVRCVLYIVFSYNSLGDTNRSLLAIIVTFTAIGFLASGRIYKNSIANVIEMSVYFNLIVLSTATLTDFNSPRLIYSLIGMVCATMLGVIMCQFHLLYVAKTSLWLKIKAKVLLFLQSLKTSAPNNDQSSVGISSHDPHKIVSKSVIELRESLLEN